MDDVLRVLLIEDDAEDALLVEHLLKRCAPPVFEAKSVTRLAQACKLLSNEKFDVVLLDVVLPGGVGIEALHKVRGHAPAVPVVALAGLKDEALAQEAVRQGAQDYLIKGLSDPALLGRCLRHAVERAALLRRCEGIAAPAELTMDLLLAMTQELSEPLSTQRAALARLQRGEAGALNERQASFLELAENAAARQTKILQDARDLSRFRSGRLKPDLRGVDLRALIEDCLRRRPLAPRCEADLAQGLPQVSADPDLLRRLLGNLLDHAAASAKERVLVRAAEAEGPAVVVSVIDDGLGGAQSESMAAGVALTVCREIVSRHGGRWWVDSAVGRGSRFHFSLPRGEADH